MYRLRWWLVSGAGIPWALRIGASVSNTHPTGQRACRRPANFIGGGQAASDWTGGISAGVAWPVFLQVERRLPPVTQEPEN